MCLEQGDSWGVGLGVLFKVLSFFFFFGGGGGQVFFPHYVLFFFLCFCFRCLFKTNSRGFNGGFML